jgi:dihydroorotate dehydrogenase (fumarate)
MPDLRTAYLGLSLEHPVVASSSPLSRTLDGIRRLEDAGASAIVLFSLFEEQLRFEGDDGGLLPAELRGGDGGSGGADAAPARPDEYLELIRAAREAVGIPIIASLNGVTDGGWTRYARAIQDAGADALELNIFHVPADIATSGREVEQRYVDVVLAVRSAVRIPLAVKVGPYFSSMGEMARRLIVAGADGLVLFNRFYQPDFDLDRIEVVPTLQLSERVEIRLPLLWLAILHGRLPVSLAATTGVETAGEVVKYLLAGADVVMTASSLLRHGPQHIRTLVTGLGKWLGSRGYHSVGQMRGTLSQLCVADPTSFERANYLRIMQEYRPARR